MTGDDTKEQRSTLDDIALQLDQGTHDLNLKQLYYFHAVATEGTIAHAAKKLKVTQATISEQLKKLEQYLEQPLLERRPGGVRLNQYGRRAYEHTTAMFRSVRRMLQDINPKRVRDRWVLEVGICPTISRTFAVQRFMPLFELESVSLRIRRGTYEDLMQSLLTGEIDLVLSENQPTDADSDKIGQSVLLETPLVFASSASLAEQVTSFPADLGRLPFLNYSPASHYRWEVDNYFVERGLAPDVVGEVDDVMLLGAAASAGIACVAIPKSVIGEGVARELVVLGALDGRPCRVYALFKATKTPELVAQAVAALEQAGNRDGPA